MIVHDTNVLSELLRGSTDPAVLRWHERTRAEGVVITAVTKAELLFGLARLPEGRRKRALADDLRTVLDGYGPESVLPFDSLAADTYGSLVAERESAGRPIGVFDAQIAAICLSRNLGLATRNVKDFVGLNLFLLDPWNDSE